MRFLQTMLPAAIAVSLTLCGCAGQATTKEDIQDGIERMNEPISEMNDRYNELSDMFFAVEYDGLASLDAESMNAKCDEIADCVDELENIKDLPSDLEDVHSKLIESAKEIKLAATSLIVSTEAETEGEYAAGIAAAAGHLEEFSDNLDEAVNMINEVREEYE